MKLRNDNPDHIPFPDQQNDGEIGTVNGNDDSRSEALPSEKDAEQHPGNSGEMVAEGGKHNNLLKESRYLAHQLNNLLTAILANTQLALLTADNEEIKSYLNAVEEATNDAGAMVHEFQESIHALAEPPE